MLVIFFPNAIGANPAHLDRAGLSDLAADRGADFIDFRGPHDVPGQLAYWPTRPGELPDTNHHLYDWSAFAEKFFLGRLKGETITPASLARRQQQPGRGLVLGDGQEWIVPVARQLPRVLGLDERGQWTGVIDPKYAEFWANAWKMLDEMTVAPDSDCARVKWTDAIDYAASALAINYRVTREIVAFLGLLRTDLIWPLIQVVTEFEEIATALAQKKTDAVDPSSPASTASAAA